MLVWFLPSCSMTRLSRQGPLCYRYSWKDGSSGQCYKLYVAQWSSSAPQLTSSTLNDSCAFCSPFPSLPLCDAFTSKILWAILNWRELEYNCLYRNKKGSPFSRSSHSRLEDHSCNTLSYHGKWIIKTYDLQYTLVDQVSQGHYLSFKIWWPELKWDIAACFKMINIPWHEFSLRI